MSARLECLREKHPRFIYRSFRLEERGDTLVCRFFFQLEPDIVFTPQVYLEGGGGDRLASLPPQVLNNLFFHLGLIEMISYWKAACSPELVIEAGPLTVEQQSWWQGLLLEGMREFFYVNSIDFLSPEFLSLSSPTHDHPLLYRDRLRQDRYLILVSGGKDSSVTLEIFRRAGREFNCLLLNPTPAALAIVKQAGCQHPLIVRRDLDTRLLQLNAAGYLNGHTPFSAYLAFLGLVCATIFDYGRLVVSNERSANRAQLRYLGTWVNHQYSKSHRFETSFREYVRSFISQGVDYYSFLRPLYEVQISLLFSQFQQYLGLFRSCNRHQRDNSWCTRCPKCLFTFLSLYPFLPLEVLLQIFGQDLFQQEEVLPLISQMLGLDKARPLECIGTEEEVLAALYLCLKQAGSRGDRLPPVLAWVEGEILPCHPGVSKLVNSLFGAWDEEHHLPAEDVRLLRDHLSYAMPLLDRLLAGDG